MHWTEVSVATNSLGADMVSEALVGLGAKGTQIIDRADAVDPQRPGACWDTMDPEVIEGMPEGVVVKAWFDSQWHLAPLRETVASLAALAGMDLGPLTVSLDSVREQDWAESWKRFYKPLRLGQRLVVRPSWEKYQPKPGDLIIHLDPGMAFGTGTHESTALCARLLEAYAGPDFRVLDVGTGSGILAIAAARLEAREVTAIDIDPVAARAARENIAKNGLEDVITARQGDLLEGAVGRYDLVSANILADVIIRLSGPALQVLVPGGVFLSSGIIRDRAQEVARALEAQGYQIMDQLQRGQWTAFAARAPAEG